MLRAASLATLVLVTLPCACGGETVPSDPIVTPEHTCDLVLDGPIAIADPTPAPTYAIGSCRVAWVERGTNRLLMRRLGVGQRVGQIAGPAPASDARREISFGPLTNAYLVSWVEGPPNDSRVMVAVPGVVAPKAISGPFHHAGEARVSAGVSKDGGPAGVVAFTGWLTADPKGDTDVFAYDPLTDTLTILADGPGQQRWPGTSNSEIAITDFHEDPDGRFDDDGADRADILVINRIANTRRAFPRPGLQAHARTCGHALYRDWNAASASTYELRASDTYGSDPDVVVDAVPKSNLMDLQDCDQDHYEWIAPNANDVAQLWTKPTHGGQPKTVLATGPFSGPPVVVHDVGATAVFVARGAPGQVVLDVAK